MTTLNSRTVECCTDCGAELMDRLAYQRCALDQRRGRKAKGAKGKCQVCYNRTLRAATS